MLTTTAPQKLANKSLISLILGSPQSQQYHNKPQIKRSKPVIDHHPHRHHRHHKRKHTKKRKAGFIYTDSLHSITDTTHHYDESDLPVDPSTVYRINRIIQDSFLSMSDQDPLSRTTPQSSSWPLLPHKPKPKSHEKAAVSYFNLKELDHDEKLDMDELTKNEYIYYYDDEKEQEKIFYKQLKLNIDDVFKHKRCGSELDVVLNEYHSDFHCLPDIEHYFILLYYNIKQSSITQLQQLWQKLYGVFKANMDKQQHPLPMIYIDFKNGEDPTNLNDIFSIIFQCHIDIKALKQIVRDYYHQWHPKCIKQGVKDIFGDMKEDDIKMETVEEYQDIFGCNSQSFFSMADGMTFPCFNEDGFMSSPTPSPSATDGTIFGFRQFKPKTAVISGVFGIAATVGLRILSANKPGNT